MPTTFRDFLTEAELLLESECPVCMEPFTPPIFQCYNGHLICQSCEGHCRECPVCREVMPAKKSRCLVFEKLLVSFKANSNVDLDVTCPHQRDGCLVIMQNRNELEDHKLDCAFAKKKFCQKLGLVCTEEFSISSVNEMITHFIFDHNFDGSFGNGDYIDEYEHPSFPDDVFSFNINSNFSISPKFELIQNCKKSGLKRYLTNENWMTPSFISFDDQIFFVKKFASLSSFALESAWTQVCIDGSDKTAGMYSARFQLFRSNCADGYSTLIHEMEQSKVIPLSSSSSVVEDEADLFSYCRFPYSVFTECINNPSDVNDPSGRENPVGPTLYHGTSRVVQEQDPNLYWRLRVSILKKSEPELGLLASADSVIDLFPESTSMLLLNDHARSSSVSAIHAENVSVPGRVSID